MEHHRLLVIEQAGLPIFHDLAGKIEQVRDNLQVRFVDTTLLAQQVEQLCGALTRNIQSALDRLDA